MNIEIAELEAVVRILGQHETTRQLLTGMEARIMASLQQVTDALAALNAKADAASAALDAEIARVEAVIKAGGAVTAADLQTIVDNLGGVSTKVDAIGTKAAGERP
jgi:type IV secretory pathway TrbL component